MKRRINKKDLKKYCKHLQKEIDCVDCEYFDLERLKSQVRAGKSSLHVSLPACTYLEKNYNQAFHMDAGKKRPHQ
jgi:hypothetical protein